MLHFCSSILSLPKCDFDIEGLLHFMSECHSTQCQPAPTVSMACQLHLALSLSVYTHMVHVTLCQCPICPEGKTC